MHIDAFIHLFKVENKVKPFVTGNKHALTVLFDSWSGSGNSVACQAFSHYLNDPKHQPQGYKAHETIQVFYPKGKLTIF